MRLFRGAALAAALFLPVMAFGQGFTSSGWLEAKAARPAPDTRYAGNDCAPQGDGACRLAAWRALLAERGEADLSAPAGGRSYRYMTDRFDFGLGLKIVRMDIDATGKGALT